MRKRLIFCAMLFSAPAAAAPESWLAGHWFGSGQPNDKSQMWLDETSADGEFHILHRHCIQGKAFDTTNDGTWSLKGDILTIRIEKVDGTVISPRIDVYRVLSHSDTRQTYRYEATGFVYNSRKVPASFQMPACDLAS